jgi:HAD superfamily hydrolase (TIGR01459 family)
MSLSMPPPHDRRVAPPILEGAGALLSRYDVIFCDVWGVLHDGFKAYESAGAALTRFRTGGGTVILVSNAPVPSHRVLSMLDARGVARSAFDHIVSSGELALTHLGEKGYQRVYYIGPRDRDAAFFERSAAKPAEMADAEALVCTGLNDDRTETAMTYAPVLEAALARNLPFVCANPDLVVDVGGRHYLCAGALADVYERMGGHVYWAGKPFPAAYQRAREAAQDIRGGDVPHGRILAVGDALRTDLAGAARAGIDAMFIAGGIHRDDTMDGPVISVPKLQKLFADGAPPAIAAMPVLSW